MSFVYLLEASNNSTYVGATVDLERRLRQHNGEIKGGARATTSKVSKGEIWKRVCYVKGFPDWQSTLQFEWRWKQLSRQLSSKLFPIKRRMIALKKLLSLDKSTSKAIPYNDWDTSPEVVFEDDQETANTYFLDEDENKDENEKYILQNDLKILV